jgi:hypothetical protein
MILASKIFLIEFRNLIALLLGLFCLLCGSPLQAGQVLSAGAGAALTSGFPSDLGKIVFRQNTDSPCQVYIVANSHRSPITGANNAFTVQAQIETFRIGEWLIRERQLGLILPEGFFGKWDSADVVWERMTLFDGKILEDKLADSTVFINAEILLHQNYGIGLRQVEDRELYGTVKKTLYGGLKNGAVLSPSYGRELEYLQESRSAAILQRVPGVIEAEFGEGNMMMPRVMLTIGLAHLDEIVKFLKEGEIQIPIPQTSKNDCQVFGPELELLKKKIGVTVIVPQVLIEKFEIGADGQV